jgi:hypothetical protein
MIGDRRTASCSARAVIVLVDKAMLRVTLHP